MTLPFPSTPALLLLAAVLTLLLLPLSITLALGLILALGFAIDVAAQRREVAPTLLHIRMR